MRPIVKYKIHAAATLCLAMLVSASAQAQILIERAWIRPAPADAPVEAYATLRNLGAEPDRLLSARSESAADVAPADYVRRAGVWTAEPIETFILAPSEVRELRPTRAHLRLSGVARRLYLGAELSITLTFERAGDVEAVFIVGDGPSAGVGMPRGVGHSGKKTPNAPDGHDQM